ncbi:MAG: SurA N-terminal domain-containing protein [Kiritimatiellae bacterium]|nr:SurA N-terminal domain-containing protein [Kiritimatiellia bacterium]
MFIYHFNRLIRNRILWGFFAFIIAVAFVAVDSCFRSPQEGQTAGAIDGAKISETEFLRTVTSIRGFGRGRDNETPADVIDRRAWEQIAARQTAENSGLISNHEEIRSTLREAPAFQGPNGFDINRYRMVLAENGMTPSIYEEVVAHQLSIMKTAATVDSATWVAPMELDDELAAMTDVFTVRAAEVSNRFANADMKLTEEDYLKFYEENKESFAQPDRVSVHYVAVPVTNYLASVIVPEDDLLEYYDSHAETYTRTVTNDVTEPIPFAEVRDQILAELQLDEARYCAGTAVTFTVYGKLAASADQTLALLAAQENSAVKTAPLFSAEETLYWTTNSKEFSDAAFELEPDRADLRFGIVKGDDYVYVMEIAERSPAHTPKYEDVLNDLRPQAEQKARSEAFRDAAKALRDEIAALMAEGKSFTEAAQAKALNVSTSLTYSVSDIQGAKFDNSFAIAYNSMTLKTGEISEAIPASADKSLLVYIEDRQPGDALSAEMMRAQVRTNIARRRNNSLFSDWLSWNLAQKDFKPARPLASADVPGIENQQDDSDQEL